MESLCYDHNRNGLKTMKTNHLPDMIRDARKHADLTQLELAQRIGVPQSNVSRWERGEADPIGGTLARIAMATNGKFPINSATTTGR